MIHDLYYDVSILLFYFLKKSNKKAIFMVLIRSMALVRKKEILFFLPFFALCWL